MNPWEDLRWFVVLNGIADAWMWDFDADRWQLRFGHPAMGSMGILPQPGDPVATLSDALWLADVLAFDHDAPVGVQPAWAGVWPEQIPSDPDATPAYQPINPFAGQLLDWYWRSLNTAYEAAAELRFNGSFVLRYDEDIEGSPSTSFSDRFRGREELVSMYAMAARQADPLGEFLCLYKLLEAADGRNGKAYAEAAIGQLNTHDFGILSVVGPDGSYKNASNALEVYRQRAMEEVESLTVRASRFPSACTGFGTILRTARWMSSSRTTASHSTPPFEPSRSSIYWRASPLSVERAREHACL